ncbi:hypothetical protein GOV05_01745 [Candidatus Woesearchaeota archaeon]|nr:hypothetical protein [Candidatus Woesearchaeota archaeon]
MAKKDICKQFMTEKFGPSTAALVDDMTEDNCVEECGKKIKTFLGDAAYQEFTKKVQ